MKWFKPKCGHITCNACGSVYDPRYVQKRWADLYLCFQCLGPLMERDKRRDVVMLWASANWEKLEPQCLEENKAQREAYNSSLSGLYKNQQVNNPLTNNGFSVIAGGAFPSFSSYP